MESWRVRHDWATSLSLFTFMHWRRKWQPTPVFLPGESQGRGAWWAAVYRVAQSRTQLKWLSSSSSMHLLGWGTSIFEILKGIQEFVCACMLSRFSNVWLCAIPAHGILQARILEWVAMTFSRRSSRLGDWPCISYISCLGRQVLYHLCRLGGLIEE